MAVVIDGTTGISTPAETVLGNLSYTGTLTGGAGVINLGSGQVYKDASGNVGIGTSSPNASYKLSEVSATNTARILQTQTAIQADVNSYVTGGIDLIDVPRDGQQSNPAAYIRFVNKNTEPSFP